MSTQSIFCIATTLDQADQLARQLRKAHFSHEDISVLLSDRDATKEFAQDKDTQAIEGAPDSRGGVGAATGGAIGGAMGLLVGMGAMAIPAIGPFIATGPILSALTGALVGAVLNGANVGASVGGITEALVLLGIPESQARCYEGKLHAGSILLSVHVENSHDLDRAKSIFIGAGAEDICMVGETLSTSGHESIRLGPHAACEQAYTAGKVTS